MFEGVVVVQLTTTPRLRCPGVRRTSVAKKGRIPTYDVSKPDMLFLQIPDWEARFATSVNSGHDVPSAVPQATVYTLFKLYLFLHLQRRPRHDIHDQVPTVHYIEDLANDPDMLWTHVTYF